jgi:hypothetical protein
MNVKEPRYRRGLYVAVWMGLLAGVVIFVRLNGWAWGDRPFNLAWTTIAAIATVAGVTLTQLMAPFTARVWLKWPFWALVLPWIYGCGFTYSYIPLDYARTAIGLAFAGVMFIVWFMVRADYDIPRD